jgi:alpha-tubulin suppressor-like RCC1 family protein
VPEGLTDITAISAGAWHSLALKSDGTVVGWGARNEFGAEAVPEGLSNIVSISAGHFHSLAISADLKPRIRHQPVGQTVWASSEDSTRLAVTAYGPGPLTYQWHKHGVDMIGETNAELWILQIAVNAGTYSVTISNPYGSITSDEVSLVVLPFLDIFTQPVSQTVQGGATVTFYVHAKGSEPISYQWRKNEIDLVDATNSTLVLQNVQPAHSGIYTVVVSNEAGVVISTEAHLLVLSTSGPNITAHPKYNTVFAGGKFVFTVEATGGLPLQYQWLKNGNVLPGATASTLAFDSVQLPDAGDYSVVVTDATASTTSAKAGLQVVSPPQRSYPKPSFVVSLGGPAPPSDLSNVIAIAAGPAHSLALRADGTVAGWGSPFFPPLPGVENPPAVPSDLSNVVAIAAGSQHNLALKSDGTVVSWGGWHSPVPEGLYGVVAVAAGDEHSLALKIDGRVVSWGSGFSAAQPPNLTDIIAVAAGGTTQLALRQDGTAVAWGGFTHPGLFRYLSDVVGIDAGGGHALALLSDGSVVDHSIFGSDPFNRAPAGLTDVAAISAGATHSVALKTDGTVVGWNGANLPDGLSHVSAIAAGNDYTMLLTDWPVIALQPAGLLANEGEHVVLTVAAAGAPPLSYQWKKNGEAISGASQPTLTFSAVQSSDAGDYTVTVSNPAGSVTSAVATLAVNTFPIITRQPVALTVFVGARVVFDAAAIGALPLSYRWQKDGVDLQETSSILTIAAAQNLDAGIYRLVVNNSYGSVMSDSVALAVTSHAFMLGEPGTVVGLGGPMVPPGLTSVVAVAAGQRHGLALKSDSTVISFGSDFPSLPGVPVYNPNAPPADLSNVVAIAAGRQHSLALRADGSVVGWRGPTVPALFGITAIAAGDRHGLALRADGTVVTWGDTATPPPPLTGVTAIAAGGRANIALKSDGSVTAWGPDVPPTLFSGVSDAVSVAAGLTHLMVLRENGTVLDYLFLGFSEPQQTAPLELTDATTIAAGDTHSLAIRSDGSLMGWNGADVPAGIENVSAISAGRDFSLLITINPPAPMLAASSSAEQMLLSAPISVSGYVLEESDSPHGSFAPIISPNTPESEGDVPAGIVVPVSTRVKFFRLKKIE